MRIDDRRRCGSADDLLVVGREDFDEMLQLVVEVIQHKFGYGASGVGVMSLDHVFQLGDVFRFDGVQLDHFAVAMNGEPAADVVDVRDAAAHAGGEVAAGVAENDDAAAGHVFAAVITHAFYNGLDTGVADGKPFAGFTADKGFAGSSAIEGDIADDAVLFRYESGVNGGVDDQSGAGEPFTKVVVGVAFQLET